MTLLLESARNLLDWFLSDEGLFNVETSEIDGPDRAELGYEIRQARTHVLNALAIIKKN